MKHLVLLTLMVLTSTLANAQNVGIGLTTPQVKLHILDTSELDVSLLIRSQDTTSSLALDGLGSQRRRIVFNVLGTSKASLNHEFGTLRFYTNLEDITPVPAMTMVEGKVGINMGSAGSLTQRFTVNGKVRIGDDGITPEAGTMRYNSAGQIIEFHDGTNWHTASSPWAFTSGKLHYDNGAVLIGRSNTIGSEGFGIRYNTTGSGWGGMYVETNGSPTTRPFYGYAIDDSPKMWHYYDGASSTWHVHNGGEKLSVRNNGNVGIGVVAPETRLDILGGQWDLENSEGDLRIGTSTYRLVAGVATGGSGAGISRLYAKGGQAKLVLGSDDSDVMTIDADNQVGIGTLTPNEELHIFRSSGPTTLEVETDNGNPIIRLDAGAGASGFSQLRFTENGALSSSIWQNYTSDALEFYNGGTAMYVKNARVGIGTLPNVNYRLSVDGKVIAEEIKVQLSQNWPDYVFTDEYQLMSLPATAEFIHRNGHLPGIPSSSEVTLNNGFEVGEMNRLLLEKIEELTLHMIHQQEEIEFLKAQINK